MYDLQNTGAGGGIIIAALLYAGACLYITGPLVAERMAEKSGWLKSCARQLKSDLQDRADLQAQTAPQLECGALLGGLSPQLRGFIEMYGGRAACRMLEEKNRISRRALNLQEKRISAALNHADARCACALGTFIDTHRSELAIYAASARLITPGVISNMNGQLHSALGAPACTALSDAGGAS